MFKNSAICYLGKSVMGLYTDKILKFSIYSLSINNNWSDSPYRTGSIQSDDDNQDTREPRIIP